MVTAMVVVLAAAACGSSGSAVDPSFAGAESTVRAVNLAFQPAQITLPSGTPLRIILDNADSGVPHNLAVTKDGAEIAKGPIISGPGRAETRFGPLTAGSYAFACDVHPNMTGTLTITP